MSDLAVVPFVARPTGAQPAAAAQRVRGTHDFGVLAAVMSDPDVTDVFVNGPTQLWVDRGRGARRHPFALAEPELRELAVRLVAYGGRHVDESKL